MVISTFAGDDSEDSKNSYGDRSAPVTDTATATTTTAITTTTTRVKGQVIGMQLVVVLYQDKYKMIRPFHLSTTALATAPDTATATTDTATTTDGELILLLLRLHRVDITHRVDTLVLLLLQSGSVHDDDDDTLDTIASMRLVLLFGFQPHTLSIYL
jgi:hypothetical protein